MLWGTSFGPLHIDYLVDEEAWAAARATEPYCAMSGDDSLCDILARFTHILQEEDI